MVGHLLGAAGAIEFVTCVKELPGGIYPQNSRDYRNQKKNCNLNYCKESYQEDFEYALSNSLGFGGHNASILVKKYAEG